MSHPSKNAEVIFHEVLAITDLQKRNAFLDESCQGDTKLRAEVDALLQWHEQSDSFLESPVLEPKFSSVEGNPIENAIGTSIGPYKLIQRIGEGGMGLVYLAEQKHPVRRRVALKIIKPGMDTREVIARFEAERQTLAILDHPNIAHVLDAGTTENGRPYFAMEYVQGLPITRYADEKKIDIEHRLRLFEQVCEAVQHAHQKGIIHRDLKPSNILVSLHGQREVPRIIDFGIAKATSRLFNEKTIYTIQGQLLGTPEYMSPEQVDFVTQDIDTRSDIYSLGVILYELLAGVLPFDRDTFARVGLAEVQRTIREQEPVSPSIRFTELGDRAKIIADSRNTQVAALTKRLHCELEWIPLKAMRKDRCRRYRSASEMADDIRNYLNGLPLIAGPETVVYRVKKFVRKHAGSVLTSIIVAMIIFLGFITSTLMYFNAEEARKLERQSRTQAEIARDQARQYAETIETMVPIYNYDSYWMQRGYGRMGMDIPLEDIWEYCARLFEEEFKGDPIIKANALSFYGHALESSNYFEAALPYFIKSLDIRNEELGENDPITIISANNLALLYMKLDRDSEAEPLLLQSFERSQYVLDDTYNIARDSMFCLTKYVQTITQKGIDSYEAGNLQKAKLFLTRSDYLRDKVLIKPSNVPGLSCLAITLYELNEKKEALVILDRLRILCDEEESVLEHHQRCLWEVEQKCMSESDDFGNIWLHIQEGDIDVAATKLSHLKTDRTRTAFSEKNIKRLKRAIARACYLKGQYHYRRGTPLSEVLDYYRRSIQFNPDFAEALNALAYIQATGAKNETCDASQSIKNATRACELTSWGKPVYLDTLATAYAQVGDFNAAQKYVKKAINLIAEDDKSGQREKMISCLHQYESGHSFNVPAYGPLVAKWSFDESNVQTVPDISGNSHHGVLIGNPKWQPGLRKGALFFNGEDSYVDCGSHPAFDITDEITVSAWIKVESFNHFCQTIISKGNTWSIGRWWYTNRIDFFCSGLKVETQAVPSVTGKTNIHDGHWHHIVCTYNGNSISLYVNGKLDSSENATGDIKLSKDPIYIGHNSKSPSWSPHRYWHGCIDEVTIYRYALNAEEVKSLYLSDTDMQKKR